MQKDKELRWYVLKVKPHKEQCAWAALRELGLVSFMPQIRRYKMSGNKKEEFYKPLFTGYIFVKDHFKETKYQTKLQFIRGTTGLLTIDRKIVFVSDYEIDVLKKVCELESTLEIVNGIKVGEQILIKEGILKGVKGVVTKAEGKDYFFIESGINGIMIKIKLSETLVKVQRTSV